MGSQWHDASVSAGVASLLDGIGAEPDVDLVQQPISNDPLQGARPFQYPGYMLQSALPQGPHGKGLSTTSLSLRLY